METATIGSKVTQTCVCGSEYDVTMVENKKGELVPNRHDCLVCAGTRIAKYRVNKILVTLDQLTYLATPQYNLSQDNINKMETAICERVEQVFTKLNHVKKPKNEQFTF